MTDATMNQTETNNDVNEKLGILADGLKKTQDMLLAYAGKVTELLTGEKEAPARRPGRPRKNPTPDQSPQATNRVARAQTQTQEKAPDSSRELHPTSMNILNLVNKNGRIKGSDISEALKLSRSLTYYHMRPLVEKGKVVQRRCFNGGVPFDVFYKADRASFRE